MSEPSCWRRGERYETCVDDGVRGSAPKLCMAYSRARCLPSPKGGICADGASLLRAFIGRKGRLQGCKAFSLLHPYTLAPADASTTDCLAFLI